MIEDEHGLEFMELSHCMVGSFIRIGEPSADRPLSLSVRG
jgi:hypothetical protein